MGFLPPKPKKLLKPQIKPECFNSRNWDPGSQEPVFPQRKVSPDGPFPIPYTAARESCDRTLVHAGKTGSHTRWEMGSIQGVCLHLRHVLRSFRIKFLIFNWKYLAFQPSFCLSYCTFPCKGQADRSYLFLMYPFQDKKKCCFLWISSCLFCERYLWKHPYFSFR